MTLIVFIISTYDRFWSLKINGSKNRDQLSDKLCGLVYAMCALTHLLVRHIRLVARYAPTQFRNFRF